jgi:hypothetical protein
METQVSKQESAKWFKQPKKEKKKRERVPGSHIARCLDLKNIDLKNYFMTNLHVGSIGDLSDPEIMKETILDFWHPRSKEYTYDFEFYMEIGNVIGEAIANRFHRAGITWLSHRMKEAGLHHCKKSPYQEFKVINHEFGYAGRSDIILDTNLVNYYGKKTRPPERPTDKLFEPYEVKSTSKKNYDDWTDSSKFSKKYRTQLSIYIDEFQKLGIIKEPVGHFILVCRDVPQAKRCCEYRKEQYLIDAAQKNATIFWDYIRNMTFPEGLEDYDKSWIEDKIKYQTSVDKRKWPSRIKDTITEVCERHDLKPEFI